MQADDAAVAAGAGIVEGAGRICGLSGERYLPCAAGLGLLY